MRPRLEGHRNTHTKNNVGDFLKQANGERMGTSAPLFCLLLDQTSKREIISCSRCRRRPSFRSRLSIETRFHRAHSRDTWGWQGTTDRETRAQPTVRDSPFSFLSRHQGSDFIESSLEPLRSMTPMIGGPPQMCGKGASLGK